MKFCGFDATKMLYLENTTGGHFKYYRMVPNHKTGKWTATYGKIGTQGQIHEWDKNDWWDKLNEKEKKGYTEKEFEAVGSTPAPKPEPTFEVKTEWVVKLEELVSLIQVCLDDGKGENSDYATIGNVLQLYKSGEIDLTKANLEELNEMYMKYKRLQLVTF